MMRARISLARFLSSCISTYRPLLSLENHVQCLRFVDVVEWLLLQLVKVCAYPRNALVESLVERYSVMPSEAVTQLGAVEHISGVLAEALADDLDAILKILAEF